MPERPRPTISVVVAAYNAADTLGGCIDSILAQSYRPLELLIVDDGSTDATARLLEEHPARGRMTVIRTRNGGPSRARNLGVEQSRGDLVAFFDADCRLDPRCLEELAGALADEDVASVGGAQLSPEDQGAFGRAVQSYFESIGFLTGYAQDARAGRVVETAHNPSCNVLYRRSALAAAGGFDEGLWPGEDVDLDHRLSRAGYRHLFQPRAVIYHYRPASPAAFARMMTAYGRAQGLLVRRYGPIRRLHYLPLALLLALLLAGLALWWWPAVATVAVAVAALAALIFVERRRHRSALGAAFYRLLWLNARCWLAGFFRELLAPSFRRKPSLPHPDWPG